MKMMKNLEKNWEPDPNIVNEIEIHLKNNKSGFGETI